MSLIALHAHWRLMIHSIDLKLKRDNIMFSWLLHTNNKARNSAATSDSKRRGTELSSYINPTGIYKETFCNVSRFLIEKKNDRRKNSVDRRCLHECPFIRKYADRGGDGLYALVGNCASSDALSPKKWIAIFNKLNDPDNLRDSKTRGRSPLPMHFSVHE